MSLKIKGVTVNVSPLFLAYLAFILALDGTRELALPALVFMLLHECGHLSVMAACGIRPREIRLRAGEMEIIGRETQREPATVLLGGPAVNLALALACLAFRLPESWLYTNLVLGCFNLLPAGGLDGGRLLKNLLTGFLPYDRAQAVWLAVSFAVAAFLFFLTIFAAIRYKTAATAALLIYAVISILGSD